MPSPFPGMDPYLENPVLWPGFHNRYIAYLSAQLNSVLPENYVANIEERQYVTEVERSNVDEPTTETYIQVKKIHGSIVTIIEVLSLSNKSPNTEGNRLYLKQQREILENEVNLLEIDLLSRGQHTVSAPAIYMTKKYDRWNYIVCLSRHVNRQHYLHWLINLREKLPTIKVPLLGQDADVKVNLQAVFNRVYDDGAYDRLIQYAEPPYTMLMYDDIYWANRLLWYKGLIKS